ncbi:hypothetical protein EYF80_024734 [Liparis tanakae]|uniref:Uncharacterized protein n=1 Tax=Liparis tanakae TaxID=230148 RepID=A0A4Z2HI91_9TELE|nr:hypothetical protein EYF80_024734 [Liparis tanakae]
MRKTWDQARPGPGDPTGGCQNEQGYLVQGGSLPVSLASLQYLSFRMNAAALGCRSLVKTPFLFPTTRRTPADMRDQQEQRHNRGTFGILKLSVELSGDELHVAWIMVPGEVTVHADDVHFYSMSTSVRSFELDSALASVPVLKH